MTEVESAVHRPTLMVVGTHPDDCELDAGGTAAKYARRGWRVVFVIITRGGCGTMKYTEEEAERIRSAEASASALVIGAELKFLDFKDTHVLEQNADIRMAITDSMREFKADLVLCHNLYEAHPDEYMAGRMTVDAFTLAALPNVKTAHPAWEVRSLFMFADQHRFTPLIPQRVTHVVDISETIDTKLEALAQHRSQLEFMREHGGYDAHVQDLLAQERAKAFAVGNAYGCLYGEPFVELRGHAVDLLPV